MSTKVITGLVRFSYLHVFTPTAQKGSDKLKFSVSLIIPKSDKETVKAVQAAIAAAIDLGKASKWNGKKPKMDPVLHDGDEDRPEDPAYANSFYLSAKSDKRPGVIDRDKQPIFDEEEIKSGDYGRASINFYPFAVDISNGVACGLNNLQKLKTGERLGSAVTAAEDDFADDIDFDDDENLGF